MIRSFATRETKLVWDGVRSRRLPPDIQKIALRKLLYLNRARTIADLKVPTSNRLELLVEDRAGQWSIRINDKWRICFRWVNENAEDVEIVDYH
jgi:proteic killer suppression protein